MTKKRHDNSATLYVKSSKKVPWEQGASDKKLKISFFETTFGFFGRFSQVERKVERPISEKMRLFVRVAGSFSNYNMKLST